MCNNKYTYYRGTKCAIFTLLTCSSLRPSRGAQSEHPPNTSCLSPPEDQSLEDPAEWSSETNANVFYILLDTYLITVKYFSTPFLKTSVFSFHKFQLFHTVFGSECCCYATGVSRDQRHATRAVSFLTDNVNKYWIKPINRTISHAKLIIVVWVLFLFAPADSTAE